jgi:hypothetical protein
VTIIYELCAVARTACREPLAILLVNDFVRRSNGSHYFEVVGYERISDLKHQFSSTTFTDNTEPSPAALKMFSHFHTFG